MNHSYTIARRMPAGHSLVGHPMCGRSHGHDFTIEVTFRGEPTSDHWMLPCDPIATAAQVDALVAELAGKQLNEMIPMGTPSMHGLALYAWERLVMVTSGLASIEVGYGDERSRISL